MQEMVSRFKVGRGRFEQILLQARELRDHCQQQLAWMQQQGLDIFDRNYQQVAGTDPIKYRTRYDEAFEQALQAHFDQTLEALPGAIYVTAVDVNGYLPAHHRRFSHPPTGKREIDLVNSRQKRIYNSNEVEIRRARNTQPFLLQSYVRDTGAILNDLSLPILIDGVHWGALILGLQPEVLQEA
jgi:methyl-accepting chemotaxis protein